MRTPSRVTALAASVLLASALAACSGGGDEEEPTGDEAVTETDGAGEDAAADEGDTQDDAAGDDAAAAGTAGVATAESDLGTILVDGEGMTLYLFTNDSPNTSVCEGECLAAWPPLLGEPEAGDGVDAALLDTFERSDGTTQVSYNGWPLYYWASDSAPGDVTGQAVNDVWWVVSPEGEAIGAE